MEFPKELEETKIFVDDKGEAVQKKLFELGGKWINAETTVRNLDYPFLYIQRSGVFFVGSNLTTFILDQNKRITPEDILDYQPAQPEFEPFQRVLVRDAEREEWRTGHYSHTDGDMDYVASGACWRMCIPYEGNEHLLGTTNDK